MDARTAYERLRELQVIDVREQEELEEGFIEGAVNIPLYQLGYRISELEAAKPVLTVCQTGQRSAEAAEMLASNGFEAHNLDGGMWGWKMRRLPVVEPGS
ncbi:MAG: rhodanese-like domain-containing protein [Actinomycetota bacterium]|nr:rhodanese-like domain-containing protein [Actinomycetota bacterium]